MCRPGPRGRGTSRLVLRDGEAAPTQDHLIRGGDEAEDGLGRIVDQGPHRGVESTTININIKCQSGASFQAKGAAGISGPTAAARLSRKPDGSAWFLAPLLTKGEKRGKGEKR